MKTAVQSWVPILLFAFLTAVAGCSSQDGGTTEPLPNVIPPGDLTVRPDSSGTMAPLSQAVAQAQPGYVIVVLPGQYDGTLVIDKPLHFLSSAGKENTILTNGSDSTSVVVQVSASFSATDSLIFEGFGFNGAREGMIVETSTVPVVMRRCDVQDNATFGVRIGGGPAKVPAGGEVVLWQCFFRRNGLSQAGMIPPAMTAGLWCKGSTISGSSVFFEGNQVGLALTDGANGSVVRGGFYTNAAAGIWMESASNLVLTGDGLSASPEIRDGTEWGMVVNDSRLELRSYHVLRNGLGGIRTIGGTLRLQDVNVGSNTHYGIWSTDSTDSLFSSQVVSTRRNSTTEKDGFGIFAESTGGNHVFRMEPCEVSASFRNGILAAGDGLDFQLSGTLLSQNAKDWVTRELENDPQQPNGGGLRASLGASVTLDSNTEITGNAGVNGGGVALFDGATSLTVDGASIHDNEASTSGAGLLVDGASVSAANLLVQANETPMTGGGMTIRNGGSFEGTTTTISDNIAQTGSGGVYLYEGRAAFSDGTVFSGNTGGTSDVGGAGGIYCNESTLDLNGVTFQNNFGILAGALYVTDLIEDLVFSDCTFMRNQSSSAGVLYARDLTKNLRVENCVMARNSLRTPTQFAPSTVYSRQDLPGGSLTLVGCTITANNGGSGAINHRSGLMSLTESVVAFNSPAGITGNDLNFVELSCNDFYSNGSLEYGAGANPGAGSISADPQFCDRDNDIYTVNSSSPLLPGANDCAVQIGALGQGCSLTP